MGDGLLSAYLDRLVDGGAFVAGVVRDFYQGEQEGLLVELVVPGGLAGALMAADVVGPSALAVLAGEYARLVVAEGAGACI